MAEYIERKALDKLIESRRVRGDCKFCAKYEMCIANGINRKGSHLYCWEQLKLLTADVVPVVRCKDCKHLMFSDCYGECSRGYMGIVSPDDYCSYGERKCNNEL